MKRDWLCAALKPSVPPSLHSMRHMVTHNLPELEESPLNRKITRDGISVTVDIYRFMVGDNSWTLELVMEDESSIIWDGRFATDADAYAEFHRTLEAEGMATISCTQH